MTADEIFVNGLQFLNTLSRDIIFGTAEHVPSRRAKKLANSLMKVVKLYAKGGFVVHNILMDGEFYKVNPEISLIELNISMAHEHVAEIQRYTLSPLFQCAMVPLNFCDMFMRRGDF